MTKNTSNTGLPHLDVPALAFDPEGRVYAGTHGHGVFVLTPPILTGIAQSRAQQPAGFALQQNYPNPFNPATRIQFSTPARGRVTLRIFSMPGRLVCTLVAEELASGPHSVTWHGLDDRSRRVAESSRHRHTSSTQSMKSITAQNAASGRACGHNPRSRILCGETGARRQRMSHCSRCRARGRGGRFNAALHRHSR